MKAKFVAVLALALVLLLVFAVAASAAVSQDTIDAIIDDARDGTIDGEDWTAEQIRAALAYVENNPTEDEYGGVKGTLEDYLASLQAPGEQSGELAFTGGEVILILGAGLGLIGGGAYLRRRVSA